MTANPNPNSANAKATLKAALDKKAKKEAAKGEPISTPQAIRGFWKQYPKAATQFGKLHVKWRGSYARRPGTCGFLAAYRYSEWLPFVGYEGSVAQIG